MRVTIDLMKKSTQIIDLSDVINPRVGDDDLLLPLHIVYGDNQTDMRGKDVEFLSNDTNGNRIYVAGTCNTDTPGDNLYMGNLTFRFPANTFKADGTYDPDKTMFRIVDKATHKVISSVNVKITVMKNNIEFDFDPDKSSYDSRAETMLQDFHDKGQAMLDDIKDLNDQAKSNVSGDTAATAKEAKQQADTNAGDISDMKGEIAGARGRYADLPGREDAQDTAINQKESINNANANYAALQQKDTQQDMAIAIKANRGELQEKLSNLTDPIQFFPSIAELKAAYPNGAECLAILNDGHKYMYTNGQWTDLGAFTTTEIINKEFVDPIFSVADKPTMFSWYQGKGSAASVKPDADNPTAQATPNADGSNSEFWTNYISFNQGQKITVNQPIHATGKAWMVIYTYASYDDVVTNNPSHKCVYPVAAGQAYNLQVIEEALGNGKYLRIGYQTQSGILEVEKPEISFKPYSSNHNQLISPTDGNNFPENWVIPAPMTGGILSDGSLYHDYHTIMRITDPDDTTMRTIALDQFKSYPGQRTSFDLKVRLTNNGSKDPKVYMLIAYYQTAQDVHNMARLDGYTSIPLTVDGAWHDAIYLNNLAPNGAYVGRVEFFIQGKISFDIACPVAKVGPSLVDYSDQVRINHVDNPEFKYGIPETWAYIGNGTYNADTSSAYNGHKFLTMINGEEQSGAFLTNIIPVTWGDYVSASIASNLESSNSNTNAYITIRYYASFNDALTDFASSDQPVVFSSTKGFETKVNAGSMADENARYCRLKIGISGQGTFKFAEPLMVKNQSIGPYSIDDAGSTSVDDESEAVSSLPIVKLNGNFNAINSMTQDSVDMSFEFVQGKRVVKGSAVVGIQGASSKNWTKKNLKFKLFSDAGHKSKLSFRPFPTYYKDSSWQLKANYTDNIAQRNGFGAEIWTHFASTNSELPHELKLANHYGSIQATPVYLYINGDFYGLMTFNTKKSPQMFGIDKTNNSQIGLSANTAAFDVDKQTVGSDDTDNFSLEVGKQEEAQTAVDRLTTFVLKSTADDFKAHLREYIEPTSVIDYAFLNFIIGNDDCWQGKNYDLTTYDGQVWHMLPWDMDSSLGSSWKPGDTTSADKNYFEKIDNVLLNRVLAQHDLVKARLNELTSSNTITSFYLQDTLKAMMNQIGEEGYSREYDRWPDNQAYKVDANPDYLMWFLAHRWDLLKKIVANMA
ncbi:CotH kinase family protein [Limosilactobacillus pontis]|uniref:CotH kinase family protein n=1 Tax=Limosilactobacillus pontis TaxID=35787 RepID=UPI0025A3521F|nr:CotH kinase family protein [Limosilactobacillus pontis]MDM8332048.1 CotH kinase family protein [Limosilactobacillus pontis]